jgi:5S rRNA maturation endonuclease (ribonuclease M5)
LLRRLKEKEEEISEVLSALAEESGKGTIILVEGRKDMEALRALGVEGPIVTIKTGGRSFTDVIFEMEAKTSKVILFLDFDRRGKQGTNRLRHSLERAGIKVDLKFWLDLLKSVGKDVQCVEGLNAYLENLKIKTQASQ